ncbi:MAG: calcium-translocating P-type ATPase, SERCA-type [Nanoarchaeota archaeon]
MPHHNIELNQIYKDLKTTAIGLKQLEAEKRSKTIGKNRIKEAKKVKPFTIFLRQFKSLLILVLIFAGAISLFIGHPIDALIIFIILIFNAIFGFIQEYRAEKSIEALKKMTTFSTIVYRNGQETEVKSSELVPGDIIKLESGNKVPADCRLITLHHLELDESALTGESVPVKKDLRILHEKTPLAERTNTIFSGTIVTKGNCKALVVSTGMKTQIGKIAALIQETDEVQTPLQLRLKELGKYIGIITIAICIIIFLISYLSGNSLINSFMIAISLAVAAVPEGLPAVVTIALAFGVRRMVKRKALIRKLSAVEALGSTDVICSDKTGTLTKSEMTVTKLFVNNKIIDVTGSGYEKDGEFLHNKKEVKNEEISLLLKIGSLCNNANLAVKENSFAIIGDPTEAALLISAEKLGLKKQILDQKYKRIDEIPFETSRKLMSTINKEGSKKTIFTKGAPDILLERCTHIDENGRTRKLTIKDRENILKTNETFANSALRVLGFAYRAFTEKDQENNLIFVGLQAMIDPPRPEAKQAIKTCKTAGIRTIMITGDHIITAKAIAKELGIKGDALSGYDIRNLSNKELKKVVEKTSIFARVIPEDKTRIVKALRSNGHVVAVTGDGVNDAPALKNADVGVSMGITGTDVAQEASDMILLDDNFASIVNAVEEGRGIYDNIQKFINYLLSTNMAEILVIFIAMLIFKGPDGAVLLPLLPIQILWINLITDGLPALALGVDPKEEGIMKRKPRPKKEKILSGKLIFDIISIAILITIAVLVLFKLNIGNLIKAQTIVVTSLVVFELVRLELIRSNYNLKLFSNKYLIYAVLASLLMQLAIVYTPLNIIFKTTPLALIDWGYIVLAAIIIWILAKLVKKINIHTSKRFI